MGQIVFLDITTFKPYRKNVEGADEEITNSKFVNLLKKWVVPFESGNYNAGTGEKISYVEGLTNMQSEVVGAKPYMLTVESDNIIIYSLDPEIEFLDTTFSKERIANPAITDDGNNLILKLSGGVISEEDSGLSWEVITNEGSITPPDPEEGEDPIELDDVPHAPFLLYGRQDIA